MRALILFIACLTSFGIGAVMGKQLAMRTLPLCSDRVLSLNEKFACYLVGE